MMFRRGIGAKPGTSQKPKSPDNGLHMCKLCSFVQVDSKEDMCCKCSKEQTMDDPKVWSYNQSLSVFIHTVVLIVEMSHRPA